MAKIDVKDLSGKKVESIELDASVFGLEVNEHLLWEAVKQQMAKSRVGTHSTKRRDEVRGGGKKPYKQKGTGSARQGSTRAPNFVGGGKVFTPKPRDYSYAIPKKAMAGALRSALSLRAKESKIIVLSNFDLTAIKTKKIVEVLKAFGVKKALIVDGVNENLLKSTKNIQNAKFLRSEGLNVYDVLNYDTLIVTKAALEPLTARLKHEGKRFKAQGAA